MDDESKREMADRREDRDRRGGHSRHNAVTHKEHQRKHKHNKDERFGNPKSLDNRITKHNHQSHKSRSASRSRSRSPSWRERKHRRRRRESSEDSEKSKSNLKNAGNERLKSKFELKSERLKVVSTACSTLTTAEGAQQNPCLRPATKLVEEINKRKLLFSKRPTETPTAPSSSSSLWEGTKFTDDPDGNMQAKFKRLMGIKAPDPESGTSDDKTVRSEKASQYLADLEKQYEVARVATHTQRGLGLGFSLSRFPQ